MNVGLARTIYHIHRGAYIYGIFDREISKT